MRAHRSHILISAAPCGSLRNLAQPHATSHSLKIGLIGTYNTSYIRMRTTKRVIINDKSKPTVPGEFESMNKCVYISASLENMRIPSCQRFQSKHFSTNFNFGIWNSIIENSYLYLLEFASWHKYLLTLLKSKSSSASNTSNF